MPDLGDPLFSIWRLAWVAHQIVNDPVHLFDANIFHPERFTLAYYSTFGWHRLVNGSSGMRPRWYDELEATMQSFPSDESVLMLRRHGVTHVMVHGELLDASHEAAVQRRLERRGDFKLVASGRAAGRSLRLYALTPR